MNRKRIALAAFGAVVLITVLAVAPGDAIARGGHGPRGGRVPVVRGFSGISPYFGGYGPYFGFGYYGFNPYLDAYFGVYRHEPEGGIDPNVAAMAGLGAVDLNVKPNRAEVWIDGAYVGEARDLDGTPSYLWLPAGKHQLEIRKGGYAPFEASLDIRRGIAKELKLRLRERPEEIASSGPVDSI